MLSQHLFHLCLSHLGWDPRSECEPSSWMHMMMMRLPHCRLNCHCEDKTPKMHEICVRWVRWQTTLIDLLDDRIPSHLAQPEISESGRGMTVFNAVKTNSIVPLWRASVLHRLKHSRPVQIHHILADYNGKGYANQKKTKSHCVWRLRGQISTGYNACR